jgi:ABC-type multidrug transport system fused ATPase/permease subunit
MLSLSVFLPFLDKESWPLRLLGDLLWRQRVYALGAVVASLCAALLEGATMAIFTVALEMLAGNGQWLVTTPLGWVNTLASRWGDRWGQDGFFLLLVWLAVTSQVLRSGLTLLSNILIVHLRTRTEATLRSRTFDQFMRLSFPAISQYKIGDLLSYVEQVEQVGWLLERCNSLLIQLFLLVVYVGVLCWLSWLTTLIALALLSLFLLPMRFATNRLRHISGQILRVDVAMKERMVEWLQALRLLHAFHQQEMAATQVDGAIHQSAHIRRWSFFWSYTITPLFEIFAVVGVALVLLLGYWVTGASGSIPRLLAFVFVLYRLLPRLASLNTLAGGLHVAWPYWVRVANFLRTDDKIYLSSGLRPFTHLRQGIELRHVTLRYPGSEQAALDDLSLTIPCGQMVALVGASGSGKSSVLNLLLRLYEPSSGQILVDGVELGELNVAQWRAQIGLVDQETVLFHQSVADNLRFGAPGADQQTLEQAARLTQAYDFIQALPQGWRTEIGDRGYRLSGGERQRLAWSRALLRQPSLLLLDEATSQLDSQTERLIQQALDDLRAQRTVIVVAHRLSTVIHADQIFVLAAGRLVEQGVHLELLARQGVYAEWWQLQQQERISE